MSAAYFYHPTHGARLFADGKKPPGWSDAPLPGQHPHERDPLGLSGMVAAADAADDKPREASTRRKRA
jgi:hypothetical protein